MYFLLPLPGLFNMVYVVQADEVILFDTINIIAIIVITSI